jgi:hypothetical protein
MSSDSGGPVSMTIEINAGNHDRRLCPVSFDAGCGLPAGKALRLYDGGDAVPVNYCAGCCGGGNPIVSLILDELPAGEMRRYRAEVVDAEGCGGEGAEGVLLTHVPGEQVDFHIRGELFTSYVIREGIARPYCYPVLGPGGVGVTNLGPSDHVHHKSMYVAQGEVNGHDNWSEGKGHASTVNKSVQVTTQGPVLGAVTATGDWVTNAGKPILEERVCICVWDMPDAMRLMEWDITLAAEYGGVFFGDTKEAGTLSVRVAESMEGRYTGRITNAYGGVTEKETWGKRAPWCDYSGDVDGKQLGIAIFDHPQNLRYPTYWHVRDYGLFTANQWGIHDFTGDWAQRGDYALPAGQELHFKFRVYIHEGDVKEAGVAEKFHDWLNPPEVTVTPGG